MFTNVRLITILVKARFRAQYIISLFLAFALGLTACGPQPSNDLLPLTSITEEPLMPQVLSYENRLGPGFPNISLPCSTIDEKYAELGGEDGPLGGSSGPFDSDYGPEKSMPDGVGRYRMFSAGIIYWLPRTCAHAVFGEIYNRFFQFILEADTAPLTFLGYPLTDVLQSDTGTWNGVVFENGAMYWNRDFGVHVLRNGDIRDKWLYLIAEGIDLGYPIADAQGTSDGRGHFQQFENATVYSTPETGAHAVYGDILEKWRSLGGEQSVWGYPASEVQNTSDGSGRIQYFERGWIRTDMLDTSLTFFQQNMALIGGPGLIYNGTERDRALSALIENLRQEQPDIVGLSEVFWDDDERNVIRGELHDIYPYVVDAPDETDFHEDSGLLLLSRHQIVENHKTIYRACRGFDCLANKGAIHARISIPAAGFYDIFLTHLQAGGDEVFDQLSDLGRFVLAHRDPKLPALLMGDLNINADNNTNYHQLLSRLNAPEDLWITSGDGGPGFTDSDPANNFEGGSLRSIDDPERHREGRRFDYFLSWRGSQDWPTYENTQVVVLQSSQIADCVGRTDCPGRDISDHYGVRTQLTGIRRLTTDVSVPIDAVRLTLTGFRAMVVTTGVDTDWEPVATRSPDQPFFRLSYESASGLAGTIETPIFEDVGNGQSRNINAPNTLVLGDPGDWLVLTLDGFEADKGFISSGDDSLGRTMIRLERMELQELLGHSATRVFPYLTGENSEYAVVVTITVAGLEK